MPPKLPRAPRREKQRRTARIAPAVAVAASCAGLLAAAAPAVAQTPPASSLLHQGSAGSDVAHVQRALHIGATGRFRSATWRAVLAYQRRHGLTVDGIVGPLTWDSLFGIKPPPSPPQTRSQSSSSSSSGAAGASAPSGSGGYTIPSGIVQCESGGNYSAVNPSSGAGGAYQILPSTWQAYGGQGLPQNASKAVQDQIASQIYAHQGASAWSC